MTALLSCVQSLRSWFCIVGLSFRNLCSFSFQVIHPRHTISRPVGILTSKSLGCASPPSRTQAIVTTLTKHLLRKNVMHSHIMNARSRSHFTILDGSCNFWICVCVPLATTSRSFCFPLTKARVLSQGTMLASS